jgi:hypothetical protein
MKKYLVDTHSVRKGLVSLAALSLGASIAIAQEPAKVSVYGFAQLNANWEDGATSATASNWSLLAPSNSDDGGSRTLLNVNHTRFGVNFSGPKNEGEPELTGKFEMDFNANSGRNSNGLIGSTGSSLRIRHSYGQVKYSDLGLTLLFGQAGDVISPRDPAILSEGTANSSGNIGTRRPQIRITKALGVAEIAFAALDDRGATSPEVPSLQGRVGAKVSGYEFGVSGHFAKEKNTQSDATGYTKAAKSWSINADALLPVIDILSITGEFFYGQNLRNYSSGSLGLTQSATQSGTGGVQSVGGWGNLGFKLPSSLALNLGSGIESITNDDKLKDKNPSTNIAVYSNLRYYFIKEAFVGLEYWHISTSYRGADDGSINRVEVAFQYAFK